MLDAHVMQPTVYSMTRTAHGPTVFVSGQTPALPDGTVPDGFEVQVRVVVNKLTATLAEQAVGWAAVVKLTCYLTDLADLATLQEVLLELLPEPKPAATVVVVAGLADSRFRVEIDAVADLGAMG